MKRLMSNGCTVLFVSHSIDSVRAICENAIWLENGRIRLIGDSRSVTNEYMNEVFIEHNRITLAATGNQKGKKGNEGEGQDSNDSCSSHGARRRFQSAGSRLDARSVLEVREVSIRDGDGDKVEFLRQGDPFTIMVDIDFLQNVEDVSVGFVIKDQFGQELTGESLFNNYRKSFHFQAGESVKVCFSSTMLFRGGQSYSLALRINQVSEWDRSDNVLIYADDLAAVIEVVSDGESPMWFMFKQEFSVEVVYG